MMAKKTPFVISKDGQKFVAVAAIMSPLCAMFDGLPMTFFGRGKTAYLDLETAIDWCRKESAHHSKEKYDLMIAVMEKVQKQQEEV